MIPSEKVELPAELMHKYEIDAEAVVKAVKRVIAR